MAGTIPTQIADLKSIQKLSISYNSIIGTLPSYIKHLENLTLFHLHGNQITGNADIFEQDHKLESFITDCGATDLEERLVVCDTCSECCNAEGGCITLAKTWPQDSLKSLKSEKDLNPSYLILIIILGCCIFLMLVAFAISFGKDKLPSINYPIEEFQESSMYRFYLSSNKFGKS